MLWFLSVSLSLGILNLDLNSPKFIRSTTHYIQKSENFRSYLLELERFMSSQPHLFWGVDVFEDGRIVRFSETQGEFVSIIFQQEIYGIPVEGARLKANFSTEGHLINISSGWIPDLKLKVQPPSSRIKEIARSYRVSLAYVPRSKTEVRLVYRWKENISSVLVEKWMDVSTGEILKEERLRVEAEDYVYQVFARDASGIGFDSISGEAFQPFDSPTPHSPGESTPNGFQPAEVQRHLVRLSALSEQASPWGWVSEGDTRGNNVDVFVDFNDDYQPDDPRPQAEDGIF